MRLREEQFWALTPAQYFALVEQANEEIKRADKRAGELTALVHNMFAKRPKDASFWFPSLKRPARKLSEEEEALQARIMRAKFRRGRYGR